MNNTSTVDLFDKDRVSQALYACSWQDENMPSSTEKGSTLSRIAKYAGLTLCLMIPTITSMPDPWLNESRRRDAVVTMSIYQKILGRFISRSDALKLARQILEKAERERLLVADTEASRGLRWED